jgi:hypothetical protein
MLSLAHTVFKADARIIVLTNPKNVMNKNQEFHVHVVVIFGGGLCLDSKMY